MYTALALVLTLQAVYSKIHERIMGVTRAAAVSKKCHEVCNFVAQASFVARDVVVLEGVVGKAFLAFASGTYAEIVLFAYKIPFGKFALLLARVVGTQELADIAVQTDLSVVCQGLGELLGSLSAAQPAERFYFCPAMVKEGTSMCMQHQHVETRLRLKTWLDAFVPCRAIVVAQFVERDPRLPATGGGE